jgi:hypothetical protein
MTQIAEFQRDFTGYRPVRVVVPTDVLFSLDKMQKVTANLLGRLGCTTCHSGFDIRFVRETDFLVNAKTLDVHGLGPSL